MSTERPPDRSLPVRRPAPASVTPLQPIRFLEVSALWAGIASLLLPAFQAALALAVLGVLLARYSPWPRRRVLVAGLALASAFVAAAGILAVDSEQTMDASRQQAIAAAYADFWDDLIDTAARSAAALEAPDDDSMSLVAAFEAVDAVASTRDFVRKTLLLVNPAGEVVAWAGSGLLHEPTSDKLPQQGTAYVQSYTAATALAVATLSEGPRPWRAVVGSSLASNVFPFVAATTTTTDSAAGASWALRAAPAGVDGSAAGEPRAVAAADGSDWVFEHAGAASLVVSWPPPATDSGTPGILARGASISLAVALLALGLAGTERRPQRRRRRPRPGRLLTAIAFAGAAASAATGTGLAPSIRVVLVLATALGTYGVAARIGALPQRVSPRRVAALGALAALTLVASAWQLQQVIGARSLSEGFGGDAEVMVLRLTWLLIGVGLLGLASRRHGQPVGDRAAWLAVALVLTGAAAHDLPGLALVLLAAASAAAAVWLGGQRRLDRSLAAIGVGLLLASLIAAASWDTAYRMSFRQQVAQEMIPLLGPPSSEELSELNLRLDDFFTGFDLNTIEPPGGVVTQQDDLAFALWRLSPLAEQDSLSVIQVESPEGDSEFSFDLPWTQENLPIPFIPGLRVPAVEAWTNNLLEGYAHLGAGSSMEPGAGGILHYKFLPRPGFRLEVSEADELETELLRGRPHKRAADGLPREVAFALYRDDGSVIESPWPQAPPLAPELVERTAGETTTPDGRAWFWTQRARDGVSVLYLARLAPLTALARTGVHALGTVLVLVALALFSLIFHVPRRAAILGLRHTIRSYARRLMLVYTVLLFLPLVALNLLLLRNVADRLRQTQLDQGEAALDSARTVLADYIRGLDDGAVFDVLFNRQLVEWLSRIADHQVNLYWNGQLVGSSQQALIRAGLLPGRVPGDIYARLAYLGYEREQRSRERSDFAYLELYAPVRLTGSTPFILSVPLLEQQEKGGRLLDRMREQATLISTALFLLLLALGGRLARSFTDPLNQLVEGTRRIASGEASLDLELRELELSALVHAIDDMAGKIAEGRSRLLREKQVVERMVESITSGVVSLDRQHRVLLHNRVAAERLGTEIGVTIEARLAGQPVLEPVLEFLREAAGEATRDAGTPTASGQRRHHDPVPREAGGPRQATIRLRPEKEGDEREWTLIWVPVPGSGDPSALLVVDDSTEVLRGQRLEAWAEMARIIAHEIKNPLTPIRLSAEHMRQVYQRDPDRFSEVLERCTDNILQQVEELRVIASEFSTYSRIPRAELRADDVMDVVGLLAEAYQHAGDDGQGVHFEGPGHPVIARVDRTLLTRAVRNLLENALRANGTGDKPPVELVVTENDEHVSIRVADRGPGVPSDSLARIFEPYFSTHDTGTGLGLPITRRIVEEHEGSIEARNRPGGGLEVAITMPMTPSTPMAPSTEGLGSMDGTGSSADPESSKGADSLARSDSSGDLGFPEPSTPRTDGASALRHDVAAATEET